MRSARAFAERESSYLLNPSKVSPTYLVAKVGKIVRQMELYQADMQHKLANSSSRTAIQKYTARVREAQRLLRVLRGQVALSDPQDIRNTASQILSNLIALHSLDQVAAGAANELAGHGVDAYGNARIDFSIGSSWQKKGRLSGLENHIRSNIGVQHYKNVKLLPITLNVIQI